MSFLQEYLRFAPGTAFAVACIVFLLATPLVWIVYRRHGVIRFSGLQQPTRVPKTFATATRFVVPLLRTLAVLALVYALARPQKGGTVAAATEGIAIEMVLDVSGSMSEDDFALGGQWVRRLDAIKEVFRDFVLGKGGQSDRTGDLIGMTTFAMYSDVKAPLTLDHANLVNLLRETEIPGWVNGVQRYEHPEANFTALGDAIVLGTDQLRRASEQAQEGIPGAEPAESLVMILLTDGADNPPKFSNGPPAPDPLEAAKLAQSLGIRVYTIGAVGTERRRQRLGFFQPRTAQVDEAMLRQIAQTTGGKYFRATDTESLATIYEEIDKLERRETGEREYEDSIFAARIAMLVGLGLLMSELLLANTRYRRLP